MPDLHAIEITIKLIGTGETAVTRRGGAGLTTLNAPKAGQSDEVFVCNEIVYRAGKMAIEAIDDWKFEHGQLTILKDKNA